MKIALTGATGFLGKYLIKEVNNQNHSLNCLYRSELPNSDLNEYKNTSWVQGSLSNTNNYEKLLSNSDCLIHSALARSDNNSFQKKERNFKEYLDANLIGTISLFEEAIKYKVKKIVFVSTCAVYAKILDDRNLDENHPLYPANHYGAYKASVEAFISSYAHQGIDICSIRPTGIYGIKNNIEESKWYNLILDIKNNKDVEVRSGGKEVEVRDVAKAIMLLLNSNNTKGEIYNCYDQYISEYMVANIAKKLCDSKSIVIGDKKKPKHQICNKKIMELGMKFGGEKSLYSYVENILEN